MQKICLIQQILCCLVQGFIYQQMQMRLVHQLFSYIKICWMQICFKAYNIFHACLSGVSAFFMNFSGDCYRSLALLITNRVVFENQTMRKKDLCCALNVLGKGKNTSSPWSVDDSCCQYLFHQNMIRSLNRKSIVPSGKGRKWYELYIF